MTNAPITLLATPHVKFCQEINQEIADFRKSWTPPPGILIKDETLQSWYRMKDWDRVLQRCQQLEQTGVNLLYAAIAAVGILHVPLATSFIAAARKAGAHPGILDYLEGMLARLDGNSETEEAAFEKWMSAPHEGQLLRWKIAAFEKLND